MLNKKSLLDVACHFSGMVYDKFLSQAYGISSCMNSYDIESIQDDRLTLDFIESGIKIVRTNTPRLVKQSLDGTLQMEVVYNVVNNINNDYNTAPSSYIYNQTSPADTWTINHDLGYYPAVTIVDDNNIVVEGVVTYLTLNRVQVTFAIPMTGKAFLS